MTAAVFLDRDGVLVESDVVNGTPTPARVPRLLDGVVTACATFADHGYAMVMVTNQPDIARGTVSRTAVDNANEELRTTLGLTKVAVCPHDDADGCSCRKPKPGMLLGAASELGIDLSHSVTVGDRWRDIEAGRRAGTRTVFVDHGYQERQPDAPDLTVSSLAEAVPSIIQMIGEEQE